MATIQFDNNTCWKCNGSGTYPSSAYNGVCIPCNGRGYILTKNAQKALLIWRALVAEISGQRCGELRVGDRFRQSIGDHWRTVREPVTIGPSCSLVRDEATGEWVPRHDHEAVIVTQKITFHMDADTIVYRPISKEQFAERLDRLVERTARWKTKGYTVLDRTAIDR